MTPAQRRDEILDASERIFAAKGYHQSGIADIAAALGMGHGTFYRYFKNKHDIAVQVLDRLLQRFAAIGLAEDPEASQTLADYRAQTGRMVQRWLALGDEQPHAVRFFHEQSIVIDNNRLAALIESYVVYTARFLDNGVRRGFLRQTLDVRATAEMLVALIFEGTRRALVMPDVAERRRWGEAGLALMFDGIRV